jgi:hypothetical protein
LRHRIELLEKQGKFTEAIQAAEGLVSLTQRFSGAGSADYQEAVKADRQVQ